MTGIDESHGYTYVQVGLLVNTMMSTCITDVLWSVSQGKDGSISVYDRLNSLGLFTCNMSEVYH